MNAHVSLGGGVTLRGARTTVRRTTCGCSTATRRRCGLCGTSRASPPPPPTGGDVGGHSWRLPRGGVAVKTFPTPTSHDSYQQYRITENNFNAVFEKKEKKTRRRLFRASFYHHRVTPRTNHSVTDEKNVDSVAVLRV